MPDTPADIRKDLIRRLFAVAIGVGVGFTLSRMSWVADKESHAPTFDEWRQLAILSAAMTATVLSWDGYLASIEKRPLIGFWRFAIDVTLVFIYMLLIMTSNHKTWWLWIHTLTYLIYVVWDFITVREQMSKYYPNGYSGRTSIRDIYSRGLQGLSESVGPIITLTWGAYFVGLLLLNRSGLEHRIFVTVLFVLAGLIGYRVDKYYRRGMLPRTIAVVSLLVADFIYVHCATFLDDYWFKEFVLSYIG